MEGEAPIANDEADAEDEDEEEIGEGEGNDQEEAEEEENGTAVADGRRGRELERGGGRGKEDREGGSEAGETAGWFVVASVGAPLTGTVQVTA